MPSPVRVTDPYLDAPDGAVLTFPNGVVYERHGAAWEPQNDRCTGLTASWCPNHGDCRCPDEHDEDHAAYGVKDLDSVLCPLHSPSSYHAQAVVLDAD